jgi:hypothetical protein
LVVDSKSILRGSTAHKFVHELRQYAEISAYLYVCFGALLFYKLAILNGHGVSYAPYGMAAIKALVLGKFIVLGHMAGLGERFGKRRAVSVIAYKSLIFLAMLLVLSILEEAVVGLFHGQSVAASLAAFFGESLLQILATCLIMLLILVPYFAFGELREALGEARLRQLLFEPRSGRRAGGNPEPINDGLIPASSREASDPTTVPLADKF